MIKLFAPKQLQLSLDQFIRNSTRDIGQRSTMYNRSFLVPITGEKSFKNFHENRNQDKPFYKLSEVTLLRNFTDPLGKYEAYGLYLINESAEITHEMQYVDDPDDYLDIDNPWRGFVATEKAESTDQQTAQPTTENNENEQSK